MVMLGDVSRMVNKANWCKSRKHMLVENAKLYETHQGIDEVAKQIAEMHQMNLEDWDAARINWYKGREQPVRQSEQTITGMFKDWKIIKTK